MANIVITHFSPFLYQGEFKSSVFYDGLIKGFTDEGHNVLQIITSDYLRSPWSGSNEPFSIKAKKQVTQKIKDFLPDLIISFNNSSITDIENIVNCPIALWDADTFQFFNDKENIKRNADRYHYMAFLEYGIDDYKNNLNVNESRICRVPGATAVKAHNEEKQYNISFIGNPFFKSDKLINFLNKHPELIHLNEQQIENKKENIIDLLNTYGVHLHELKYHKTSDQRAQLLSHLLKLKPTVFGPATWLKLANLSSEFIEAYDPSAVYSLEHNEKIYNRSKISVSTNHTQNTAGYPWRIHDIMGSNSVLLAEHKKELINDFSDTIDLQMYKSPSEAYSMACKLLGDTSLRLDLITQQNDTINTRYRWKHRFQSIQQLTGVDLSTIADNKGTHELFRLEKKLPIVTAPRLKAFRKCFKKLIKTNKKIKDKRIEYN